MFNRKSPLVADIINKTVPFVTTPPPPQNKFYVPLPHFLKGSDAVNYI
jgi:hypothetical protein